MIRSMHPLILAAVAWLVMLAADRARRQWPWAGRAVPRAAILPAGLIVLLIYGAIVVWYTWHATFFDPAEPTITAVASVFGAGKPLYPALDAPERYAHIYGPVLFITHALAMAVFGQSIIVSKTVGALAVSASLFLAYRVFAEQAGRPAAVMAVSMCALVYLDFSNSTFWTRPEPLLLLCTSLSLYSAGMTGRLGAVVVLGVAAGLSVNLKVSGPVYLLPAFALLASRHGRSGLIAAAALAALIGVAPFLLPNVSATHYLQYIEVSARNGLLAAKFRQNLEWMLFLSAPLAAGRYVARDRAAALRRSDAFPMAIGFSLAVVTILASKPGAGPYHLLPSVAVVAYGLLGLPARVWEISTFRSLVAATGLTALVIAIPRQITLIETVRDGHLEWSIDDVRRFADAHPSSRIAVGYSGTSRFSDARTEMVFRMGEYWLDAPAVQEYRLSGLALPASTIRILEDCRLDYWLLPTGADAFAVPSAYWPNGPQFVFPEEFRQAFFRHYERTGATRNFTVWTCRTRR
jgi:hypothetical protein